MLEALEQQSLAWVEPAAVRNWRMSGNYIVDPLTSAVSNVIHPKKEESKKPELIAVSDGPITLGPNGATVVLHKPESKA